MALGRAVRPPAGGPGGAWGRLWAQRGVRPQPAPLPQRRALRRRPARRGGRAAARVPGGADAPPHPLPRHPGQRLATLFARRGQCSFGAFNEQTFPPKILDTIYICLNYVFISEYVQNHILNIYQIYPI